MIGTKKDHLTKVAVLVLGTLRLKFLITAIQNESDSCRDAENRRIIEAAENESGGYVFHCEFDR